MSESATTFSKAMPSLIDDLSKGFLTKLPQNTIPSQIEKEIVTVWRNLNFPQHRPVSEKTIVELLYLLLRENAESLFEGASSVKMLIEGLDFNSKSISKGAQTDALRTTMAPGPSWTNWIISFGVLPKLTDSQPFYPTVRASRSMARTGNHCYFLTKTI